MNKEQSNNFKIKIKKRSMDLNAPTEFPRSLPQDLRRCRTRKRPIKPCASSAMAEMATLFVEEIAPRDSDGEDGVVSEPIFSDEPVDAVPETDAEPQVDEVSPVAEESLNRKARRKKKRRGGKKKRARQWDCRAVGGKVRRNFVSAAAQRPHGRGGATIVADAGSLYVFGGADRTARYFDDVWRFDCSKRSWTRLRTEGDGPQARADHGCVSLGDGRILVHGGSDHAKQLMFDDTFVLDLGSLVWSRVRTTGELPFARDGHVMVNIGPGEVLLFGGSSPLEGPQNDMYKLHFQEPTVAEWTQVLWEGPSPAERDMAAGCVVNVGAVSCEASADGNSGTPVDVSEENNTNVGVDTAGERGLDQYPDCSEGEGRETERPAGATQMGIVVCGGRGVMQDVLDDSWLYNVQLNSWEKLKSMPGSLCAHAACALNINEEQVVVLQGGWNGNGSVGISGNLLSLSLSEGSWSTASLREAPRFRSCACSVDNGSEMYVFGGINEKEEVGDLLHVKPQISR
eukprot:scaffold1253_cov245-Pinguiococcus_pyrenoidosus.AAC.6